MDVNDVMKKRHLFNATVEKLIQEFELETGMCVHGVNVKKFSNTPGSETVVKSLVILSY